MLVTINDNKINRCALSKSPVCSSGGSATACCSAVPSPTTLFHDCNGFPSQFLSCPDKDTCGASTVSLKCIPGTEGYPHPDKWCENKAQTICPNGTRSHYWEVQDTIDRKDFNRFYGCPDSSCVRLSKRQSESNKCLPCSTDVTPVFIDCQSQLLDIHHYKLKVKEDFCGCSSPPIPVCNPRTVVNTTNSDGTPLQSNKGTKRATCLFDTAGVKICPNWNTLISVEIDCGGWPEPELEQLPCSSKGFDPCGCPLPIFTCKSDTIGYCSESACPKWSSVPLEIDCQGTFPPVLNRVAPHPCGCEPPLPPVCKEGTGPDSLCAPEISSVTAQIDCRGRPQDINLPWEPGMDRLKATRACSCKTDILPYKSCLVGSECPITSPCPAGTDKGPGGQFFTTRCPTPVFETVDCAIAPLQAPDITACECPPLKQFRCATDSSCYGKGRYCDPYVCGLDLDIPAIPGDTCKFSCNKNSQCVIGYVCSVSECVPAGSPSPPLGGCTGDESICEPFGCNEISNMCFSGCWTDKYCAEGATCTFPVVQPADERVSYSTIGTDENVPLPTPELCNSDPENNSPTGKPGVCIRQVKDPSLCYSQDETICGAYACGKNNTQLVFSAASCRATCSVDSHCNRKYHCSGSICVRGYVGSASCTLKDADFCTPYSCGLSRSAQPLMNAQCRTTCNQDAHCAPLYVCVNGKCGPSKILKQGYQSRDDIPKECYLGEHPTLCLRVAISVRGDHNARSAYVLPWTPAISDSVPQGIAPCSRHADCRPYLCGLQLVADRNIAEGSHCLATCSYSAQCSEGYFCKSHLCQPLRSLGTTCDSNRQCGSNFCIDGVCCNTECSSDCMHCKNVGICQWVEAGTDPRRNCGTCETCVAVSSVALDSPKRVCGSEKRGRDPKNDCNVGTCSGNSTCLCDRNGETGFWAGDHCDRCHLGFGGPQCTRETTVWRPPQSREGGDALVGDARLFTAETRPIQYPIKVNDYSTQVNPHNVNGILGEPDATAKYYSYVIRLLYYY